MSSTAKSPPEILEITKLDTKGESLRRLRVISGRVSVFRSSDAREMLLWENRLRGMQGPDRFSILLDGQPYLAEEQILIGFDEQGEATKVSSYLLAHGVPGPALEATLLQHGLGGLGGNSLSSLNPAEQRTVRILAATSSAPCLLIMHEPFAGLAEGFREALAERLVNFAWQSKSIVLVTKLSDRPACWVNNDFIVRIPLEPPRSATIGGSGNSALIRDLREQFKADADLTGPSAQPREQAAHAAPALKPRKRRLVAALAGLCALVAVVSYWQLYGDSASIAGTGMRAASLASSESGVEQQPPSSASEKSPYVKVAKQEIGDQIPILRGLPHGIGESIALAFDNPAVALRRSLETSVDAPKEPVSGGENLMHRGTIEGLLEALRAER